MAADHELDLQSVSETMFRSNEEDIKSRFAILLTSVKSALVMSPQTMYVLFSSGCSMAG